MAWVKLDDRFAEHPKLVRAGPLAIGLWVAGLAYCNRNLTDGFIPYSKAEGLISWRYLEDDGRVMVVGVGGPMSGEDVTWEMVAVRLVRYGLWDEVDGGYQVHDYLDYQPSRLEIEKDRAATRARAATWRAKHRNATSNAVSNAVSTNAPYPVSRSIEPNTLVGYASESVQDSDRGKASRGKPEGEREPAGFLGFYESFPRREGRRAAAKAFAQALRRRPEYTAENLTAAAKLFASRCQETQRDPQFICHPATWLNQERFREFFDEEAPA